MNRNYRPFRGRKRSIIKFDDTDTIILPLRSQYQLAENRPNNAGVRLNVFYPMGGLATVDILNRQTIPHTCIVRIAGG